MARGLLVPLDAAQVWVGVGLLLLGVSCMVGGTRMRHARVPTWVETYPGRGPSSLLPLPVGGWGMVSLALVAFFPRQDALWFSFVVTVFAPGVPLYLLFAVLWCPQLALPRWYRRAKWAGVAPTDLEGMTLFRALPVEQQKALVRLRREEIL